MLRLLFSLLLLVKLLPAQSVDAFFKDTFEQMLRNDPQFATGVGRHEYDDRWTDWSRQARDERRKFFEERLAAASAFSKQNPSTENSLTLRLVEYDFRSQLDAWDLDTHLLSVGQLFGIHNRVYTLMDRMPARTVHDYENIIARLRAIPSYVDQNIQIFNEAIATKMMQPRVVADLVTAQLTAQMNQDAEHTHLLDPFKDVSRQHPASRPTTPSGRRQPTPITTGFFRHGTNSMTTWQLPTARTCARPIA